MPNCQELEPLVTAWIDGVASEGDRRIVEMHLEACPPCRVRAQAEGSVRALIRGRASDAFRIDVPTDLKERCRAVCATRGPAQSIFGRPRAAASPWRVTRAARLPIAAVLVLAIGGVLFYGLTALSTTTLAAQLTLDHIKCFGTMADPAAPVRADLIEDRLRERHGWTMDVPGDSEPNRLHLLGGRRCLYGEGTIAHVLYRHNGAPLSLFMLPDKVTSSEIVEVLGHSAIIWPHNQRTYVLLGNEPREELEKIAGYIRRMMK